MKKTRFTRCVECLLYSMLVMASFFLVNNVACAEGVLELRATVAEDKSILLQWESDNLQDTFQIYKSVDEGASYQTLATLSGQLGTVECHDIDVEMGKTYFYKLAQMSGSEVKNESAPIEIRMTLGAPTKMKAKVVKNSRVKLTWNKVKDATSYTVYRSTKQNSGYKKVASTKKSAYIDYDVKKGKVYYYKIVSNHKKNKKLSSSKSQAVSAYVKASAPDVVGTYAKGKIKLTWKKVKTATGYYVYKQDEQGEYQLVKETKKLYYKDSDVEKGKAYTYKVCAVVKIDGKENLGEICDPYVVKAVDIDPNKKMVALTYDDGPGRYTKDIVQCLKENQAKATFYVIGGNINSYKDAMKAADRIGCEIGNHTYTHPNLASLSEQQIQKQINDTDAKIKKVIGHKAVTMRPPGGSTSNRVEKTVGKPIILWSVDTLDWKHRNSSRTVQTVMDNVKDGDIILMHDIHESTKNASKILIPKLRREGYQLVTVSELAQYRGYALEKGKVYNSLRKKKKTK